MGVGPWIVSDKEDTYSMVIGQFRLESHADIFIAAMVKAQNEIIKDREVRNEKNSRS